MAVWSPEHRRAPRLARPRVPPPRDRCYIAVKPCGCVVDALLVRAIERHRLRRQINRWLARGWTVGRVSEPEARQRLTRCCCEPTPALSHQLEIPV